MQDSSAKWPAYPLLEHSGDGPDGPLFSLAWSPMSTHDVHWKLAPGWSLYLLDGILFASHLCNFANGLDVILQIHFQTSSKGEVSLGFDADIDALRQHLPVPVPHARVPQALDQRDIGLEIIDSVPNIYGHFLAG